MVRRQQPRPLPPLTTASRPQPIFLVLQPILLAPLPLVLSPRLLMIFLSPQTLPLQRSLLQLTQETHLARLAKHLSPAPLILAIHPSQQKQALLITEHLQKLTENLHPSLHQALRNLHQVLKRRALRNPLRNLASQALTSLPQLLMNSPLPKSFKDVMLVAS
jgi:hypothetical protein